MPKLKGPLFSVSAHGTMKDAITFQGGPSGPRVQKVPKHRDMNTPGQSAVRTSFLQAASDWRALDGASKAYYNTLAEGQGMTGYNLYLKNYLIGVPPPPPSLDFEYTFDTDQSAEWTLEQGTWLWNTGNSRLELTDNAVVDIAVASDNPRGFGTYESRMQPVDTSSLPGMIFGYLNASNYFHAVLWSNFDIVRLEFPGSGIGHVSGAVTITPGNYYKVTVEWIAVDHVKVYVDDVEKINWFLDTLPRTSGPAGCSGGAQVDNCWFDYLKYTEP